MYKIIINKNNEFNEVSTLGKAFTTIDNYCKENKCIYGLGNIYHMFDNQIGIDVYDKNNNIINFIIIENVVQNNTQK